VNPCGLRICKTILAHKVATGFLCVMAALLLLALACAIQGCVWGGRPEPDYALTLEYKLWREAIPLGLSAISLTLCVSAITLWVWASRSVGHHPPRAP
jgi:hypothetical protein